MDDLNERERAAIEAVAGRFSGTWEKGSDPPDAFLNAGGKRVALDIRTLGQRDARGAKAGKPRLRFDKVATRVIDGLQASLGDSVPDGMLVLVTITAPIRLPAKTAAALEGRVRTLLGRGSGSRSQRATIHGNRVQIRLVRHEARRAPRVIGFVHNSDSDPLVLVAMTREWLELTRPEGRGRRTARAGARWLVLVSVRGMQCLGAYRYIHAQLGMPTGFDKIAMVFA